MDREFLDLYNRELQLLHEQAREFAEEYPGIAERLGGLVARPHGSDGRRPAGRRGVPRGARAAQAEARVSGIHQQPARATGAELSGADALGAARQGRPALCRSGAARRPTHRARLLSRRDLSRARPPHRLPLSPDLRHHAVAVRHHRRRIFRQRRRRCRRSASPSAPKSWPACGCRSRTARAARLEDELPDAAGSRRSQTPGSPAAARPSCRSISSAPRRTRRALRADLRALRRRLLPLSRRVRRSGRRPGAGRLPRQIGFDEDEALLPNDKRIFRGFDLLREYFMFPRKFLGFSLTSSTG